MAALLILLSILTSCAGRWIVPEFSITPEGLSEVTKAMPAPIRDGITARPEEFLRLAAEVLDQPRDFLLLVDKENPLPLDYAPPDLVRLDEYGLRVTRSGLLLRAAVMPAVMEMTEAARAQGIEITYSSAYRSSDRQADIYAWETETYGRETADRESARPGHSQHQLGTTVDFGSISDGYEDTPEGAWVTEHAWEYGFSLSYPEGWEAETGYRYESWHYRYITRAGTRMQRGFFGDVQQLFLEFWDANRTFFEEKRIRRL